MKTKLFLALLFFAVAIGGWHFSRTQTVGEATAPKEGDAETLHGISAPPLPESLDSAEAKLRKTTELMKKQLIPMLAKMPEEQKRAQDLIRFNDEMLRQLAELKTTAPKAR